VFQSDNLWPALTAHENVATALRLASLPHANDAAQESLERFGLGRRGSHRVSALSGGEQQRVAIAAAAARGARLVLADEPTGELDEENEKLVLEALRELKTTVVVVTHSERVAGEVDRVIEMRDGRVAR
jgi:putative ABC transport system ATP-binding protein